MRAALTAVVLLALAPAAPAQGAEPLRKSDLVRMLAGGSLTKSEIADLVGRNCLSFLPTARDRADLRGLGADDAIMARVDECARRAAITRATVPPSALRPGAAVPPRVAAPPAPPPRTPAEPARSVISPARTGFVAGTGQRGRVGTALPQPLVLEVRDTANRPVAAQAVSVAGTNAQAAPERGSTDSLGQVRVSVTLGPKAQPAVVRATIGALQREATLTAVAGPAAKIAVACGAQAVSQRLTLRVGTEPTLRVRVTDAFDNALPVTGLRVAVGDDRVVRTVRVAADDVGSITLRPDRAGWTNLAIFASGLRETFSAAVVARGEATCP